MMDTDAVLETLCFIVLEYRAMDKVQNPINSESCNYNSDSLGYRQ
jgi:hypothetical protein